MIRPYSFLDVKAFRLWVLVIALLLSVMLFCLNELIRVLARRSWSIAKV